MEKVPASRKTYAYWTGSFNGNEFTADEAEPQWLDHGFDRYAGVTFEDGKIRFVRETLCFGADE